MSDYSSVGPPQTQNFNQSSAFAAALQRAKQVYFFDLIPDILSYAIFFYLPFIFDANAIKSRNFIVPSFIKVLIIKNSV